MRLTIVGALTSSRSEGGTAALNRRLRKIFLIAQVALSLVPLSRGSTADPKFYPVAIFTDAADFTWV
jgi:hypothetical protein